MPLANVFAPMGFRPADVNGMFKSVTRPVTQPRVAIGAAASADIAIGDAYSLDANGFAYHAGADAVVRGICLGFELQAISGVMNGNGPISIDYATPTTSCSLIGVEDPDVEFEAITDPITGAVQANVGGVFDLFDVAPDATLAQSRQGLNVFAGPGAQFRLIKILQSPADNTAGASCRVTVRLAQSMMGS